MNMEMDKASRLAMDAQVQEPWLQKQWRRIKALPDAYQFFAVILSIAAVAALLTATWWEMNNAGGGYMMLGKGVASPFIAWTAGAGFTIAYLAFHRFTAEAMRDHRMLSVAVAKPAAAALVFGILSLGGVFANLVDNASLNDSISTEQGTERAILLADYRALKVRVETFDEIQMRAMVAADTQAHNAMVAEAAGWGMADLDPEGACLADLKTRQRQLCNVVNGPDGLLSSILQGRAALESYEQAKASLELARRALEAAPRAEGAEFWGTASAVVNDAVGGRNWPGAALEHFSGVLHAGDLGVHATWHGARVGCNTGVLGGAPTEKRSVLMDYLALMAIVASGIIALVFAARSPAAGTLTMTLAWVAGIYLSAVFIALGAQTHAFSPVRWSGDAEIGPIALLILVLALTSPLIVDWDRDGRRN